MSNLIIVESPTKIKTIKRYLSDDYEVVASKGHVRDLPKSKLGVDIDNNFEPKYVNIKDKEGVIKDIKKLAKKSDHVYLAGDPDREGEAISWHLALLLGLDLNDKNRVTFNELTETGIKAGMSHPRSIDINLVNAQQARRILDRLVGYKLSPFLWRKIRKGLSAGRVQSVAVKMICDRENEIRAFVSQEYWSIDGKFSANGERKTFAAKLNTVDGEKPELKNKEQADKKNVLFMPTWGPWLEEQSDQVFEESEYCRRYRSILENRQLQKILSAGHVKIIFHIHPKLKEFLKAFQTENSNVELIEQGTRPLNELIMECSMLLTDYSSVSWDVYYLGKPVVFYQFDYDLYMQANGSYLDMKKELFGDRYITEEEVIRGLEEYVQNDFREKEKYGSLRQEYFAYNDQNNCKRILEFLRSKGY